MGRVLQIKTPRWAKPLLGSARYKGAYGGRGSGKSHFFAELLLERMVLNPNTSVVCVREIQRALRQSVKRLIEIKIEQLGVNDYFDVRESEIRSRYGDGLVIFEGMQNHTAESIKSLEGFDVAWVEEAQTLSQRSLDLLRPTIRKPGSELWFSWNPRNVIDPIDTLLRGNSPPGAVLVRANYSDNPWFPDVLRTEMEYDKARDPDKYAHVWLGEYVKNSGSRVFTNWRIDEFEAPADAIHRLGADFGFSVDPTVLVRCHTIGRTLYIDYEAYMVGCEIVNTPALFMTVPDAEKWPIIADSARPETVSHLRKNGFPRIFPALKGPKSIEEGVEWLKSYNIVVHPRCVHAIDELTLYSYKIDPLTNAILPVLADRDNHVIDALRYAMEGVRRAENQKKPTAVAPVPVVNKW
jgi:phage terminase large subunit